MTEIDKIENSIYLFAKKSMAETVSSILESSHSINPSRVPL